MNFFLLLFALFILNNISKSQNIKEIVQINHNATWYEGKILKFENGSFYVSYYVWSHSWNEWGNKDKLKGFITNFLFTKFKRGDKVEVEYGMILEPTSMIVIGGNKFQLEYEKKNIGKKWVSEA